MPQLTSERVCSQTCPVHGCSRYPNVEEQVNMTRNDILTPFREAMGW